MGFVCSREREIEERLAKKGGEKYGDGTSKDREDKKGAAWGRERRVITT